MGPSTGLGSLIKLDKDDFAGKPELAWAADRSVPMVAAIQPDDPGVVPEEAAQIVRGDTNEILGRITSSRYSPTLNRSICLGQVAPDLAVGGTKLTVLLESGERIGATVIDHHAHFDPAGERLRG